MTVGPEIFAMTPCPVVASIKTSNLNVQLIPNRAPNEPGNEIVTRALFQIDPVHGSGDRYHQWNRSFEKCVLLAFINSLEERLVDNDNSPTATLRGIAKKLECLRGTVGGNDVDPGKRKAGSEIRPDQGSYTITTGHGLPPAIVGLL
jgi:hypothetical protein